MVQLIDDLHYAITIYKNGYTAHKDEVGEQVMLCILFALDKIYNESRVSFQQFVQDVRMDLLAMV